LEKDLEELNLRMADPACFSKPGFITSSKERIARIEQERADAYDRWGELSERPQ
jgi:hypothetical protein